MALLNDQCHIFIQTLPIALLANPFQTGVECIDQCVRGIFFRGGKVTFPTGVKCFSQ